MVVVTGITENEAKPWTLGSKQHTAEQELKRKWNWASQRDQPETDANISQPQQCTESNARYTIVLANHWNAACKTTGSFNIPAETSAEGGGNVIVSQQDGRGKGISSESRVPPCWLSQQLSPCQPPFLWSYFGGSWNSEWTRVLTLCWISLFSTEVCLKATLVIKNMYLQTQRQVENMEHVNKIHSHT